MKVAIITITGGENYGNRLQNYAVQKILEKNKVENNTINNYKDIKYVNIFKIKHKLKSIIKLLFIKDNFLETEREKNFNKFNKKYIKFRYNISNKSIPKKLLKKYDKFICGSDQIWNPNYKENANVNFLNFSHKNNNIAFAPSFGASSVPKNRIEEYRKYLENIKYLSVREETGKQIVEDLTGRKDVEVLVDPTMLLTAEEWDKISKKPKQLRTEKYILNYFLGELSEKRKKEIDRVAKENNCEVINILDTNDPFYQSGPSEFLYLEKNAFLICTDSFHSCVFSIIYNRPFIVFDREQKDIVSMNSRIETLLNKFGLQGRKFNDRISKDNLKCDYENAYKILEDEKVKANIFLKRALNIQGDK